MTAKKSKQKNKLIVVLRGQPGFGPDSQKYDGFKCVTRFVLTVMGGRMEETEHMCILYVPDHPGNSVEVRKNVLAYTDVYKHRNPVDEQENLDRMVEMTKEKGVVDAVGWSSIIGYLQETYMRYSISEILEDD